MQFFNLLKKLSDDGVSKLRLVVTVKPATEKSLDGALVANAHCPELLNPRLFQESD